MATQIEHSSKVYNLQKKTKTNILCQTFAQECRRDDGDHQPQGATVQPQVLLDKTNFKPKEIK